ncbi:MAG: hypothetical protein C5B46_06415 [Proteobacteria bacterium]|nr:MAG: hypothetical protein C5B46_06415 [Pseudomonadota bacterium]
MCLKSASTEEGSSAAWPNEMCRRAALAHDDQKRNIPRLYEGDFARLSQDRRSRALMRCIKLDIVRLRTVSMTPCAW